MTSKTEWVYDVIEDVVEQWFKDYQVDTEHQVKLTMTIEEALIKLDME